MPIYFGHAANKNKPASDTLRAQNINLLRAAPTSYKINFLPDTLHVGYAIAVRFLAQLFIAFATQEKCTGATRSAIPKISELTPFKIPPIVIAIADNNKSVIDAYIKDGYYQQTIRRQTLLMKDNPTHSDVQTLLKDPSVIRDCFVPWKFVNLNAMLAFFVLQKLATLMTQTIFPPVYLESKGKKRQKTSSDTEPSQSTTEQTPMQLDEDQKEHRKIKWEGMDQITNPTDNVAADGFEIGTPLIRPPIQYTFKTIANQIKSGGVYFPFVPDLCRQDTDGPLTFITVCLFNTLGNSIETCRQNLEFVRSGWGVLSKTDVGDQLAHFFRVFELSIQGQASFRPIFTGNFYEGAVVLGECFTIVIPGNSARPKSVSDLKNELLNVESHYNALNKIAAILNKTINGPQLLGESLTSTAMIRSKVLELPVTQSDVTEIQRLSFRLRFSDYWAVNPSSLLQMTSVISTGTVPDDAPVSPWAIATSDVGHTVLSCFGKSCPSFIQPSGRELNLRGQLPPQKTETVPGRGRKRTHEVAFDEFEQTIQVRLISWKTACQDLDRVRKDGVITVVTGTQARASGLRVFRGQQRAELWGGLAGIVHNANANKNVDELTQDIGASHMGGSATVRRDEIAETDLFSI